MYKQPKYSKTVITTSGEAWKIGESIEDRLRRVRTAKETIKDTSPKIYTARKDGVIPAYDIRSDKFDHAIDLMNTVTERRVEAAKKKTMGEQAQDGMKAEGDGGAKPV